MKIKIVPCLAGVVVLLTGCVSENNGQPGYSQGQPEGQAQSPQTDEQARLLAQARISRSEAETIALQRVPTGTVKACELANVNDRLFWSVKLTTPGSPDITVVNVGATTGGVL